jgi:hypothetical protein
MPAIRARSARWVPSFGTGDKAALRAAIAGMARSHNMARAHKKGRIWIETIRESRLAFRV